jgi:hypothetical protein
VCRAALLRKLCSCAPLINEQAIEDPIHAAITKPNDLAENPLLDKAKSFGNGTTARIVNRTGDNDFVHLMHLERVSHHHATRLGDNAFSLHRRIEPIAQFDAAIPSVETIVHKPDQGILIPDPQVVAFAIHKLEESLFHVGRSVSTEPS